MRIFIGLVCSIVALGCSKASPKTDAEIEQPVDNAATRYVGALQMDVRKAESAVNRMNRSIDKTENAVAATQSE